MSYSSYDGIFFDDEKAPSPPPLSPTASTPSPTLLPQPSQPQLPPKNEVFIDDFAYSLDDLVGHGEFALTYKGRRVSDNKPAAIKIISKKNFILVGTEYRSELFNPEDLMQLRHANIVALLAHKETDEHLYMFLEYCNQGNLAKYLDKLGLLSETTIKFYLKQIAEGIKVFVDKGVVHRDLNPGNILLHCEDEDPVPLEMTIKLSNFSIARSLEEGGSGAMAMSICGHPFYLAPEIHMGLPYDIKADLWSIGAVTFTCLVGGSPKDFHSAESLQQILEHKKPFILPRPLGCSENLWNLLTGLLKLDPTERMSFEDFYNHAYMRNTPTLPIPRKRKDYDSDYSYSSSYSYSPDSPPLGEILAQANLKPVRLYEGEAPKGFEEAKYVDDSNDLHIDDFVVVPIVDSPTGLVIDSAYDPVAEVILPCVRVPRSQHPRRSNNGANDN